MVLSPEAARELPPFVPRGAIVSVLGMEVFHVSFHQRIRVPADDVAA